MFQRGGRRTTILCAIDFGWFLSFVSTSQVYSPLSLGPTLSILRLCPCLLNRWSRRTLMSPAKMIRLPCRQRRTRSPRFVVLQGRVRLEPTCTLNTPGALRMSGIVLPPSDTMRVTVERRSSPHWRLFEVIFLLFTFHCRQLVNVIFSDSHFLTVSMSLLSNILADASSSRFTFWQYLCQ